MRENFNACLEFTLQAEGGFCNVPGDSGGATCWGVTRETLSRYFGRPASIYEVRNLTKATASEIYKRWYWTPVGCDSLPAGVDLMGFDICVNMGPSRARQFLEATHTLQPVPRINAIHALRMGFWRRLAVWSKFGTGWTRRETACHALALKMASGK